MEPEKVIIQKLISILEPIYQAKPVIKTKAKTSANLSLIKRKIAKKYKIPCPSNIELLKVYHKLKEKKMIKPNRRLEELLRIRKIRSLSGIVNVSVLTKPYPCPGQCIYCPIQKGIPKSYLENEPAVMRAVLNKFNPYKQVQTRLESLKMIGHPIDKIELRIIGGTWSYYPKHYQDWFVKECFRAANNFALLKSPKYKATVVKFESVTNRRDRGNLSQILLTKEQKRNERAKYRIVGITIETRPDFINKTEIILLRKLGVTRVELGIQSIYDNVLDINKRGHRIEAVIKATQLLKDAGFKICYQMMPNLPGSNLKKDKEMFYELFSNPDFQPDLLKIYPLALLKEAPLYRWWKQGKYKPYNCQQLTELLKSIKKEIPYYCRIQRIIRDIPSDSIVAGCKKTNLRQIVAREIKQEGWRCKCIRCREVKENYDPKEKVWLFRQDYKASGGKEIFLSYENKKRTKLFSLLRLRLPSSKRYFIPALCNAAIIREVHTYGQMLPISEKSLAPQHKGLGKKLIKQAEKIVKKEFGLSKITVISGIGVYGYYRKLGYRLKNTYMVKSIQGSR